MAVVVWFKISSLCSIEVVFVFVFVFVAVVEFRSDNKLLHFV